MSSKSLTSQSFAHHMPVRTESNVDQGRYSDHSRPRKRMHVTDPDDDVEPEVKGSCELSNAKHDHDQRLLPIVKGSGERRQTLFQRDQSHSRAFKVASQPKVFSRTTVTQGGTEVVQHKDTHGQRHQLSTVDPNNIPDSYSEGSDEDKSALARDVSKSNQKQEAQRSPQYQQGPSQACVVTGSGKRFDHWEEGSESETSDASDTAESQVDSSDARSDRSEETSSDSGSDDEETSADNSWSKFVSNSSISKSKEKSASFPKRAVYFRTHPSITTESASEIKQRLQSYLPDATVLMEFSSLKTAYLDREVLNTMLSQLVDGEISEILVADSNHICATKDGFNMFALMCHKLGAKVFILPALQSV